MRLSLIYLLHFSNKRTILYNCWINGLGAQLSCFFISWNLQCIFWAFIIIDCLFYTCLYICWVRVFDGFKMTFESFLIHFIINWIINYRPRKRSQLLHYYGRFYNLEIYFFNLVIKAHWLVFIIIEPKSTILTKIMGK